VSRFVFFHWDQALRPEGPQGGAETALVATARALAARGHEVRIVGRLAADAVVAGVRFLSAGPPGTWNLAAGLARVADGCDLLASTLRADVLEGARDLRRIRRRVLWPQVMSVDAVGVPVARLVEVADAIVVVSRAQGAAFADAGVPGERLILVPCGLDAAVFHPDASTPRVPGRVVFSGALVPDKGADLLLRAMPAVRRLVPEAELVLCGSAALWGRAPYIDADTVAREHPYVHFQGALAPAALAAELRAAVLAVVPTPPERWVESFGMASTEAQACGTPVVVARNGGLPETVRDGETGWVVDASPEALAAAVVRALRDPECLARMGTAAAAWARGAFSWARNAETWEGIATGAPAASRPGPSAPEVAVVTTWAQRCGLARHAEQLVAALPRDAVRVLAEEAPTVESGAPAVPVERVWRRGEPLEHLAALAERAGVRLVHVNHHGALFGRTVSPLLEALAARGIRSVVALHAPNQLDPEIAAIGRAADAVVVHGEGSRLEVLANGVPPEKVRVVPPGFGPMETADATATRAEMGLAPDERLLVSAGFLQPHKGILEVIRALAALRGRLPLQYLVLGGPQAGDASGTAYRDACLAEATRLGVADALTIVEDYLPEPVVARLLRAADAIVLPYATGWWEASAAARQALASGRPVVTTPALAFHDLGAAVFRTTGAFHLAQAIESVLTVPALAEALASEARALAERDAWPRVAERHQALWREVLARPAAEVARVSAAPRVLFLLREHATRTGGGDVAAARTIADAVDPRRAAVVWREGGQVERGADLVQLFNFSTYDATHAHALRAVALGIPFVVTAFYEDWPAFKVAAETSLQDHRRRLGLPPSVDLEAYARLHEGEERDLLARMAFVAEHARAVIATGAEEAARLARDFPGARVRVIPLGIPRLVAGDADAFRARYGTRDFVLSVGRVEPRKNQLALLEALADDPVDVVLATGGQAYRTDYLEACRAFRRRGRTLYLPALSPAELAGAYRAARVHVLPSWFELPGFVTLEALAAGTAAVASDRGTIRDYLGDTILYAPPDDPAALRRAIDAAGGWSFAAARERAARFTPAVAAEAWVALYAGVLAGGAPREPVGRGREVGAAEARDAERDRTIGQLS
jgi:glycosyltransferase involved in cell wall biosynthesis